MDIDILCTYRKNSKINIKVDFYCSKIWWFQKKVVPLRLYCLCISSKVLILGNGGIKETQTYQEDPYLNKCVETLQKIDFEIRQRENRKEIVVKGTQLHGTLTFYIND